MCFLDSPCKNVTKGDQKVTNAKSLRENEGYCLLVISGRYQVIISLIELRALKKCIQIDFSEYTLFNKLELYQLKYFPSFDDWNL